MKKVIEFLCAGVLSLFATSMTVNAEAATNYVDLETMKISTNGKDYAAIKEYDDLEKFLDDYDANKLDDVYITDFLLKI